MRKNENYVFDDIWLVYVLKKIIILDYVLRIIRLHFLGQTFKLQFGYLKKNKIFKIKCFINYLIMFNILHYKLHWTNFKLFIEFDFGCPKP